MDLTRALVQLEPGRRTVGSWLLSSNLRLRFVGAARSRLALLAMAQGFRRPRMLVGLVTGEAEALQRIRQHQAGVLLCTDQLDQGNGFSLVAAARALVPDLRVLMILCERQPDVKRAMALGVEALLLESELGGDQQPLSRGLVALAAGQPFVSAEVERLQAQSPEASEEAAGPAQLTPREEEVLMLIIQGCTDREIAEQLNLSAETVRGYSKDIRRKFGARSRVELLGKALRKAMGRRHRLR